MTSHKEGFILFDAITWKQQAMISLQGMADKSLFSSNSYFCFFPDPSFLLLIDID